MDCDLTVRCLLFTATQFITQLQKTNLRSNLATCLLIRYTAGLLRDNLSEEAARPLYQFLQKMLRQKNEVRPRTCEMIQLYADFADRMHPFSL